jgi:GntR family transcriptional regulator
VAVGGQPSKAALEQLRIAIDRDGEVPIGVQIAWAIRARIGDGTLAPGQRLPGIRELAETTRVNFNTIRVVYQRLETDGLIHTQRGTGTFVAPTATRSSALGEIAASAALEARASGIDPRDVAAVLYSSPEAPAEGAGGERRRLLRMQITALELALAEIEAEYPRAAPRDRRTRASAGPRLLSTDELVQVRIQLMRRVAILREAIDDQAPADKDSRAATQKVKVVGETAAVPKPSRSSKPKRRGPRPSTRTAPASG